MSETTITHYATGLSASDIVSFETHPRYHWLVRLAAWMTSTRLPTVTLEQVAVIDPAIPGEAA